MPKPNRNDCKNNGEQTNLLQIQGASTKISNGLFEKEIQTGGGIACQVPDNYQPLATNKLLLALFSLFTNAITQLAAAIAIPSSGATSDNFSRFSLIS